MAIALLIAGLQLNAQGIIINKTNGTKIYYPANQVQSVTTYGYGEEPQPGSEPIPAPSDVLAVDLGLPSGTKWANMNVGATAQNEYGLFFAWGETVGYSSETDDGHLFNWSSYKWMTEGMSSWQWIKKYQIEDNKTEGCWYDTNYKFIGDSKAKLTSADDAAHANWGGNWYMPTYDEIKELLNNTTSEWTTLKGVYGCKFTSKINGNSIFLPAAGYRSFSALYDQGTCSDYWSSSLYVEYASYYARTMFMTSSSAIASVSYNYRYYGRSVRPVLRK